MAEQTKQMKMKNKRRAYVQAVQYFCTCPSRLAVFCVYFDVCMSACRRDYR